MVDLLAELEDRQKNNRLALASVMRERRRRAAEIPEDSILPRPKRERTHRTPELQALAYHRLVAEKLDDDLVAQARRRLRRWAESGRIHPRWRQEWERVPAMPIPKIARLISSDSKRARELRQTSPFAGRPEHVIRAAADITTMRSSSSGVRRSLVGFPDAPEALLMSLEADVYPRSHPERVTLL